MKKVFRTIRQSAHFWPDARAKFVKLLRQVEKGHIPGIRTKSQFCSFIGCSERWAEAIIAGNRAATRRTP